MQQKDFEQKENWINLCFNLSKFDSVSRVIELVFDVNQIELSVNRGYILDFIGLFLNPVIFILKILKGAKNFTHPLLKGETLAQQKRHLTENY